MTAMNNKGKYFVAAIMVGLSTSIVFSQESIFPDGIYTSIDQMRNLKPAFHQTLQTRKGTAMRGSRFYLSSSIDSMDNKYIRKKIFAYVKNDSIFLN